MTLSRRGWFWAPLLIAAALFAIGPVESASACACCADPGEYRFVPDAPISDYQRAQLAGIQFTDTARLYLTDAGEEAVKGLASVTQENTVSAIIEPARWQLTFRTADGKSGTLKLIPPARLTTLAADLHETEDAGQGPILYKEWRCEGVAKGDGIFQEGFAAPARYTLVLQGRGNRCDNAEDFKHWRLEISGKAASYAFFGTLRDESSGTKNQKQKNAEEQQVDTSL